MEKPKLIIGEKRSDGRLFDQLRPTQMKVGILKNANGSSLVQMGDTKVIAAVYGPREVHPRHLALPDRAILRVRYHMTPFSTNQRKNPAPTRREIEISKVIREALEPSVISNLFPRTAIDIFIEVLQADAGTRTAAIMAASLALADGGIPMKDLVSAVAVGKVEGNLVLDLNEEEDNYGEADLPIAIMPSLGNITLLQMNGEMSEEELKKAIELAMKGIRELYEMQKEALRQKYVLEE